MKKVLFLFSLLLVCGGVFASDVYKLQATSVAFKSVDEYGNWDSWSEWEDCNILVVVNFPNDRINIYSSTPQEYDVYEYEEQTTDGEGGTIQTFKCIDASGTRCDLRLRVQADKQMQLYIDYLDVTIVYNIEHKQ